MQARRTLASAPMALSLYVSLFSSSSAREGRGHMEFYEVVSSRHSVREFQPDAVPREVLERVIAAAATSPSRGNEQPWAFYVTTGEARRALGRIVSQTTVYLTEYMEVLGPDGYERAVRWYSSLGDAPIVVAVAAPNSEDEFRLTNRLLSIGAAIENLLLAAADEGLGACPFTFAHWVRDEIAGALALPAGTSVVSMIALGWPAEPQTPSPEKRSDIAVWLD